jgi:4-hydroxy 2-oxovalerate aldolase
MRADLRWGFDIPYMITGMLNQHPRSAMQFNETKERDDIVRFFDMMVEKE